ncbi:hypothetical protein PCC9214_04891 [Planktothrix tepida]|uniref:DUF4276 family protein n=2 Tax=Planktothrix TaxID=54304 RepID=A0A1J1LSZ0_9CYAN|nr:hypothetical protein [Planktothrix tepida]CAD5981945.1 hypothetical protein PCC9214_04891 [Planktothrix tepida]CUR35723.1 conserved hypothetical protein [Planktothrix tepida PCC 9214]
MCKIFLWAPESDYDAKTVHCIAKKIVTFHRKDNVELILGTKQAYNHAIKNREEDGLQKAVEIYLKDHNSVLFLIDYDGRQSEAARLKQPNSFFNRINKVVENSKFSGRVQLILICQELEAWLLVDCLGICCYYTKSKNTRTKKDWQNFANKHQIGRTENITEAESGGKGAKEYLENFSKLIAEKRNRQLKEKDLKKHKYTESLSPEIADYLEINRTTIERNSSLKEFDEYLCPPSNREN